MKKILVTGIAGFIGSVVTELMLESGYEVIGIDNLQDSKRESVSDKVLFFEGNYGDAKLLDTIFSNHEIDCVFHLAAETTIEYSMTQPSKYFVNNVVNGISMLDTMLKHNINKIIFSSTAATFGEPQYTPIDEDHPKIPINAYGESKLMFEVVLEWYHKAYGLKYNLFRYFNAAGATAINGENRKNETHIIPLIVKSVIRNEKFYVFGNDYNTKDGTCIRDYVHVLDIAKAHLLSIDNLNIRPNAKYNLGNSIGFSILDILNTFTEVTGKKVNWTFHDRRIGDPAVLIASNKLAEKELGWKPVNSSVDKIIHDCYNWSMKKLH